MWSYPNMIPLGPAAIKQVVKSLKPFAFDRLHGRSRAGGEVRRRSR